MTKWRICFLLVISFIGLGGWGHGITPVLDATTLASNLVLKNNTRTVFANSSAVLGSNVKSATCHTTGKVFWEIARAPLGDAGNSGSGLVVSGESATNYLGQTANSIGVYGDGGVFLNNSQTATVGTALTTGVPTGFAADLDAKLLWVTVGDGKWNNDILANQNPSTGTGGISFSSLSGSICVGVEAENGGQGVNANLGQSFFVYNVPTGFSAWNSSATVIATVSGASSNSLPKMCTNVHLATGSSTPAQNLTLMQTVGANCARDALNWDLIETSAAVYTWTASNNFDTEWSTYCGAGLFAIMNPTYNNTLYAAGIFSIIAPGSNTTAFVNFSVAAANHFISTCPSMALEYTNEPNLTIGGLWWSTQWGGGAYAVLAQTAAAATAAAQATVKTYSGALSPGPGATPGDFSVDMTAGSPMLNVQQFAQHPYDYVDDTPSSTIAPTILLYDMTRNTSGFNRGPKPFPITEHNYPVDALINGDCGTANLNQQGKWLGWSMLNAIYMRVPVYTQYDLVNDGTSCVKEQQFGLFTQALSIRPSGTAFQQVAKNCLGTADVGFSSYTYDTRHYPGTGVYEVIVHKNGANMCRAIWFQNTFPYGTASSTTTAAASYTENVGGASLVSAQDLLGNSVACSISTSVLTCPALSESTGPVIVLTN